MSESVDEPVAEQAEHSAHDTAGVPADVGRVHEVFAQDLERGFAREDGR